MVSVCSIALTREGVGVCLVGEGARHEVFTRSWQAARWHGVVSLGVADVISTLAEVLGEVLEAGWGVPLALALVSPDDETSCFVDETQSPQTSVLCGLPLEMPLREVPEHFRGEPWLSSVYRGSVLRRLQQAEAALGVMQRLGISSLGGLICRRLTGCHVDACVPEGVGEGYPHYGDEAVCEEAFRALGVDASKSVGRVRACYPVGKVSFRAGSAGDALDGVCEVWAGVPVYHMGSGEASMAYALASNPLSWACVLGWDLRASWCAGGTALAKYEICVDGAEGEAPVEATRDDWTHYLSHRFGGLRTFPGPRRGWRGYGLRHPSFRNALIEHAVTSSLESGSSFVAPLGSGGLHFWQSPLGTEMAGMMAAHGAAHVCRAVFESHCYALRYWREVTGISGLGPVRLVVSPPWSLSAAQCVSDILNAQVFVSEWCESGLAALGASTALCRELEIFDDATHPHVDAFVIDPQVRARYYEVHYGIHCQLMQRSLGV